MKGTLRLTYKVGNGPEFPGCWLFDGYVLGWISIYGDRGWWVI